VGLGQGTIEPLAGHVGINHDFDFVALELCIGKFSHEQS
jgi:hypothetical protein